MGLKGKPVWGESYVYQPFIKWLNGKGRDHWYNLYHCWYYIAHAFAIIAETILFYLLMVWFFVCVGWIFYAITMIFYNLDGFGNALKELKFGLNPKMDTATINKNRIISLNTTNTSTNESKLIYNISLQSNWTSGSHNVYENASKTDLIILQ